MFTDQDKVYIENARANWEKGHKFEKLCRRTLGGPLLLVFLVESCRFLIVRDEPNIALMYGIILMGLIISLVIHNRNFFLDSDQSGSQHELKLIEFLEAKLAENEVGTEKDSDLNADQSAEQAGQPSS